MMLGLPHSGQMVLGYMAVSFFIGWCKAKERMVGVWAHGSGANIVYIARMRVGRALFFVGAWGGGRGGKSRETKGILSKSYIKFAEKPRKLAEFPKFSGFYFHVLRKFVIKKFGALHPGLYLCTRHLTATPDTESH